MEKEGFLKKMFAPVIFLALAFVMAFSAAFVGYSEVYALWIAYVITITTAIVLMVQLYKAKP